MYKLSNEQFDKLKKAVELLPYGEGFRALTENEQNVIVSAEAVLLDLIRQKKEENKKIAEYIAERRKTDKNYARPKKG